LEGAACEMPEIDYIQQVSGVSNLFVGSTDYRTKKFIFHFRYPARFQDPFHLSTFQLALRRFRAVFRAPGSPTSDTLPAYPQAAPRVHHHGLSGLRVLAPGRVPPGSHSADRHELAAPLGPHALSDTACVDADPDRGDR
jgi:hypothetical protein